MAVDSECVERIVGRFLRLVREEPGHTGFAAPLTALLEELQANLPGVGGALLLSAWPRSTPEPPIYSSAWDLIRLQEQDRLRAVAHYLSQIKDVTYLDRSPNEPAVISWLAGGLRNNDPRQFAILPLRCFVPPEFSAAPPLQMALLVAFIRADGDQPRAPEPHKEDLQFLAWLIAHLRINWEAPRLARRSMDLASTIEAGVTHILAETPPWADAQTHFGQLVDNIRILMSCDTCQLYLFPAHAACMRDKNPDRVWLVAEQVATREGLRNMRSESSLVSYLWRNSVSSPLAISDLLDHPQFRPYALSSLGLTRHFLGMLLTTAAPYEVIGALTLRDRYARADDGHMCIARDGFSGDDGRTLHNRAADLVHLLTQNRGLLMGASAARGPIRQEVDRICRDLYADTCQLYLIPEVIGKPRGAAEDYMELYYHSRHSWLGDANYARGERLTGRVLAGATINEPDMFLRLSELEGRHAVATRRKYGKYRLSQHFLAVPIPAPTAPTEGGRPPEAIGVLKVRDRLQRDRVTLGTQGFSKEDEYLLQAFARMISVKIAIRAHLMQRETEQLAQGTDLAHAFRHDLTNMLRPAMLRMQELPGDLEYVPRLLERAGRMVDRSWRAARLAEGRYTADHNVTCDLGALLRELFPAADACLAPQYSCEVNVVVAGQTVPTTPLLVRCDPTLLELAILVLPVWLHHHVDPAVRSDPQFQLKVNVGAQPTDAGARLELRVPVRCDWPAGPEPDETRERGYHLCYTNLMISPLIPWDAFVAAFRNYNCELSHEYRAGVTRVRAELEKVPAVPTPASPQPERPDLSPTTAP
jgi:hypothetical protein